MAAIWSDSPITTKKDDEFGRSAYALRAATLIVNSHSWDDSIVFGLTGPWGSGKSSMLAMIVEELEGANPNWRVARFTPWATGDVAGLLSDFYSSLSGALPAKATKKLRNALGTLIQVSAPTANAIPWAGGVLASAGSAAGTALKKQTPWDKAFKSAADELRKLDTPLLLIADDIDRLQTDELLALLKVVRLLGRFPGVHYLLAYDEATLFQALSEANLVGADDGSAGRFMEKIVQYPLVVPPLLSTQLLNRIDAGLDAAMAEAGRPALQSGRLSGLVEVFRSQLATPRAIDRFLAQLRHHLPLMPPEEINDEDVIVLTLLRTAFPTLYQQLPRWRDPLLSGHTDKIKPSTTGIEYEEFDFDFLLKEVPSRAKPDARRLLIDLFPKLDGRSIGYGPAGCRVADARYFDRYFAMGIPSHDVSDLDVAAATASAGNGDSSDLVEMLTTSPKDRAVLAIGKAISYTDSLAKDAAGDGARLQLIEVLLAVYGQIPEGGATFFLSPGERITRWISNLIGELTDDVTEQALTSAIAAAPLWLRIQVVEHSKSDKDAPPMCVPPVIDALAAEGTKFMLEHFKARDDAPAGVGPGWVIYFLTSNGKGADLAAGIVKGLADGDFTIADVAARFVTTRILHGANTNWELGDFNQKEFDALAPPIADPFYGQPVTKVDEYDTSWANRRLYAAGRAKQPS